MEVLAMLATDTPASATPAMALVPLPTLTAWLMHPPMSTTARGPLTPSLRLMLSFS